MDTKEKKFDQVSSEQVRELRKKFTLQQLAEFFGVSRQAVYHREKLKPTNVKYTCTGCGQKFDRTSVKGRPPITPYCEACKPKLKDQIWEELAREILD